jgi:hypothetical protein
VQRCQPAGGVEASRATRVIGSSRPSWPSSNVVKAVTVVTGFVIDDSVQLAPVDVVVEGRLQHQA